MEEKPETGDIAGVSNGYHEFAARSAVEAPRRRRGLIVPLVLFFVTVLTTLLAGAYQQGPIQKLADLLRGVPFSFTLISILGIHEMGHYLTSRRYGVRTTLPFFLPGPPWFPFGIGTFGAFIQMRSPILRRRALVDIGAAGPIAGFIAALIAAAVGLKLSQVVPEGGSFTIRLGNPLIFNGLSKILLHPAAGQDVLLHPVAFAAWIGFLVTSLNLLPMGQLDGGHISYALVGRRSILVSLLTVIVLLILARSGWSGWFLWAVIGTVLMIVGHPPVVDEEVPLDWRHRTIAWIAIAILILTFIPVPIEIG